VPYMTFSQEKGSWACRYRCNTVEGAWLAAATHCMVVTGK
jgi:hypothetical protein